MSIEAEKNFCPHCSTKLQYHYINLTEKILICTKKKCLFPFDVDDISPYIIKFDSIGNSDDPSGSSSSSNLLNGDLNTESKSTSNSKSSKSRIKSHNSSNFEECLPGLSQAESDPMSTKSNLEPLSNGCPLLSSSTKFNKHNDDDDVSVNSKSLTESSTQSLTRSNNKGKSLNLLNEVSSNFPEKSVSDSNINTITLKTLGVTLKVDPPNKDKSQIILSPRFNELPPIDLTGNDFSVSTSDDINKILTTLNMNDFPIPTVEESSVNITTRNGLLNVNEINTTSEVDVNNILTVEEYSQMLFGQSDININLDLNTISNFKDVNMQGNDANMINMDLDEILGTFDPFESNKVSGNDMDLDVNMEIDLESLMANLNGGSLAESGIPNDMSGNDLNMDFNSIYLNMNGVNGVHNDQINGHLDIFNEMINVNSNCSNDNDNMIVDLELGGINGQNGYHENIEKTKNGVNGLEEDEGKNVIERTINEDSVTLTKDKKGGQKNDIGTEPLRLS